MQIVPRRFCHISTKMSVLWPSKYAKIRFRPGLRPGPRWGSSRRSPRSPSRLKRGHPSPYHTPLGTNPPSAIVMRPPRIPGRSTPMPMAGKINADVTTSGVTRRGGGGGPPPVTPSRGDTRPIWKEHWINDVGRWEW